MKYLVFYKNVEIGVLEINDLGQHKYTPNPTGVLSVKDQISAINELMLESEWREPIPFFKIRIDNAKRFSKENDIKSHTDHFRMVRI